MQQPVRATVWRLKRTWSSATVYQDFLSYLKASGLYDSKQHHKSDLLYRMGDSSIEFGGLDDAQKLHGLSQHISWLNEAVEADRNSFDQLEMRTSDLIIIDYNPTEEDSWIYDLERRPDVLAIHSTQADNPFLGDAQRRKILSYEPTPENIQRGTADAYKWSVYGLGLPAKREGLIYPNFQLIPEWPAEARPIGYGLDFGFFPDPTALARVGLLNGKLVIDELLYENELNTVRIAERPEIPSIQQRLEELGVSRRDEIIADSAAKTSIAELQALRYNVQPVRKYPGSVEEGIALVQAYQPFYVTERSLNAIAELKNYTRKKNFATGTFLREPIDAHNHILDLVRYVVQTKLSKPARPKGMRVRVLKPKV